MMEAIKNAAAGWSHFNENGKYAVLLLGTLLYLWHTEMIRRQGKERQPAVGKGAVCREFLVFGTLTAVLAAVPVTAALLMMYQTKFYDYEWVWAAVPLTAVVSYGITMLYTGCCEKYWKDKIVKPAAFAALGLAVIALCGNLQGSWYRSENNLLQEEKTGKVLDEMTENGNNKDIFLWAPREIMDSVRALDGSVKLLYGRNMWEDSLNAYSYDRYEPELVKLYEWMESAAGLTEGSPQEERSACMEAADACIRTAVNYGVNRILLPENIPEELHDQIKLTLEQNMITASQYVSDGYAVYSLMY